jgi:hypothetical protein
VQEVTAAESLASRATATGIAEVVGRDRELATIARFLGNSSLRGLLIEGAAGIGKTTLWQAAVERARERGDRVLVYGAVDAEAGLSLSALADLLAEIPREAANALPEVQQRALAVALAEEEAKEEELGGRILAAAFLNLARALAAERPLVLAIDDLQWVDGSSAAVLVYALRRLRGAAAKLVASCRSEHDTPLPFDCERVFGGDGVLRIAVGPLSEGALHRLLHERLGASLPRPVLRAVHETSGGNPFYALELVRSGVELAEDGSIRLPGNLELVVHERLKQLPAPTRSALAYVSALPEPTLEVLARVVPEDALEPAIAAEVLEARAGRVRFSHPLLASAAWASVGDGKRREIHRALAEAVEDPEQRARHLALSTTKADREVADALQVAAGQALRHGAPAAAADLLERARCLTPAEDPGLWAGLTEAAARAHYEAGDWRRPLELVDDALACLPAGRERARILLAACEMRPGQLDLARQALAEAEEGELRIHALLAMCQQLFLSSTQPAYSIEVADEAHELAERLERRDLAGVALTYRGASRLLAEAEGAREDLAAALEIERELGSLPTTIEMEPTTWVAYAALLCDDDFTAARPLFEAQLSRAAERGHERDYALIAGDLATHELEAGNLAGARGRAQQCLEFAEVTGDTRLRAAGSRALGLVTAWEGDLTASRALLERSLELCERVGDPGYRAEAIAATGFLDLCNGRPADAAADFSRFRELTGEHREPLGPPSHREPETRRRGPTLGAPARLRRSRRGPAARGAGGPRGRPGGSRVGAAPSRADPATAAGARPDAARLRPGAPPLQAAEGSERGPRGGSLRVPALRYRVLRAEDARGARSRRRPAAGGRGRAERNRGEGRGAGRTGALQQGRGGPALRHRPDRRVDVDTRLREARCPLAAAAKPRPRGSASLTASRGLAGLCMGPPGLSRSSGGRRAPW